MNYLSHQKVARTARPNASGWFFVGNILPDLLAIGNYRLHRRTLQSVSPLSETHEALVQGVQFHFDTDSRFHSHPDFKAAMELATQLLRATPFATPPQRLFFVSHIFVEIALDGRLIVQNPGLADDLYDCLETCGVDAIAQAVTELLSTVPLPDMEKIVQDFLTYRYLENYVTYLGQADALARVCRRARVPNFTARSDRLLLAEPFQKFAPLLTVWEPSLLAHD